MAKNTKKRRMIVSAVALLIIMLSTVSVGYALMIQAQTSNTDNTDGSKYIVLTLGSNTASDYSSSFDDSSIYYDTVTTATGTVWTPHFDTDTDDDEVNDAVKTGEQVINVTTVDSQPYIIKMSKTGTMDTTKFMVGVKIGSADETFIQFGASEFAITSSLTGDKTVTVALYYKATEVTSAPGSIMDDVTINFSAYAEY